MNEKEMKDLFWKVFNCNGEDALHEIVTNNKYFKDANNWYPYGGRDKKDRSNFSTFENQQPHSGAALVEKITNSIDALLLKRCKQEGINPKSQNAPKTMEEATEIFFEIPKGDIGELTGTRRSKIARDNMQIIATGNDDKPDLMVYDYGEGQHPDNFKNTFCSIANNNKTDIPFVQGKYNMGSTGAVVFCGKYKYQLIASKMNQKIFDKENKYDHNLFGWTLIRRHILTDEEGSKYGSSWYEYFAIKSIKIPQFSINELDIGLPDNKKFTTGSFVKLFSYEMPKGAKGAIHDGLYQELNQLLYKPALPIWLLEKRSQYAQRKKTDITVHGNYVRMNISEEQIIENKSIYEQLTEKTMGTVTVQVFILKKGEISQQHRASRFIGTGKNVIYVLNGQVQAREGKSFITKELNCSFLKDSMLVVIDCSKIKTEFRQDLFMADRFTLKQTEKLDLLRNKVINTLKGNAVIKRLNAERKNAIIRGGDDKKGKELIQSLLSQIPSENKSLIKSLIKDMGLLKSLNNNKNKTAQKQEEKQEISRKTKRYPSIFKMNKKDDENGKKIKSIPLNGKGKIEFETDVEEDYFSRPQDKGEFIIEVLNYQNTNKRNNSTSTSKSTSNKAEDFFTVDISNPTDGSIKLTLTPREELSVDDEIKLNAQLTRPEGDMESLFYVKIVKPEKSKKKSTKSKLPENSGIPNIIQVIKKDNEWQKKENGEPWTQAGWDEDSIISIIPDDDDTVSAIAINMSSHSLEKYLSKNKAKTEKDIDYLREQYKSKIYLHGLFLYSILNKLDSQKPQQEKYAKDDENNEKLIAQIFKDYGDVLIYLDTNKEILKFSDDE